MRIDDLHENPEDQGPLYVSGRDFEIVPGTQYKGYAMGDTSIDDDDGFVKMGFKVCKLVKTTTFEWNGRKYKQDHYSFVSDLIDPRSGNEPSPYGRFGRFTEKDLDIFGIKDPTSRESKLGKDISYEDMYRYTVDHITGADRVDETTSPAMAQKIDDIFGTGTAKELLSTRGSAIMFHKDKLGRNWRIVKHENGTLSLDRDYMMEGDVITFEASNKALIGRIVSINEDSITIEGGIHPFDEEDHAEYDYSDLTPETDLSTMPHRDQILAISREIYYLMHEAIDQVPADADDEELALHDQENMRDIEHWDAEARKLGYEAAMDLAEYPFVDMNWYHIPTHRLFSIYEKDLKQDQRFRGTVNETVDNFTIDDIKHLERLNGLEDVKSQAISLVSTPSKRPISPEKQAWLKHEINGKKDKMAVIKLMYDLMLGGEGMKVIGSNSKYRRRFDEDAAGDRRSFTVSIKFNDGGKATRVFLARNREEALSKAMKWAKNEYDAEQGVEAKVVAESDAANAITQAFSGMAAGVKTGLVRRAGLLALQGRQSEADNTIRHLLKDADPSVAAKIKKAMADIKPVKVGDKVADTSAIEKSKAHTDWLDKTFVPWAEKLLGSVKESANETELDEAEYHGREVKLGKPMSGDVKKYKVYVKDPKTGNVKKVNFGDKGMEIKRDNPARRRNFRKRHGCGTARASDRTKAAYWSCRMWSSKPVSKILKGK